MTDLEQLRAALASDDTTPAGIDVAAIRKRARRTRRRTVAATSVAVVAVLAAGVAVPLGLRHQSAPVATAPTATLRCPPAPPVQRDIRPTVPFAAHSLLLCSYDFPGNATRAQPGPARITAATVLLDSGIVAGAQQQLPTYVGFATGFACAPVGAPKVLLQFAAADGRTASATAPTIGCPNVRNHALDQLMAMSPGISCPEKAPQARGGSADTMLPAPRGGLLLCRYDGASDDRTPPLTGAAALTGGSATALVEQANALPTGVPSCPPPDRTELVAILGPGHGGETVVAGLGCPTIGNGARVAGLGDLETVLERLTG